MVEPLTRKISRSNAADLSIGREIAEQDRLVGLDARRHAVGVRLLRDGFGIGGHQGADAALAAVAEAGARIDVDRVGADRGDVLEHGLLRALAEGDHGDHRGDADDDAEHREEGAQLVRQHGAHRHAEGFGAAVEPFERSAPHRAGQAAARLAILASAARRSPMILPSLISMIRSAWAATRGVVGHDDDRVALAVQLLEQRHEIGAAPRIERAGRLVGQDHLAAIHQSAGHADALLLAARQRVGTVAQPVFEPEPRQQIPARAPCACRRRRRHRLRGMAVFSTASRSASSW